MDREKKKKRRKKLENNKLNGFSYNFMVTLDSITQKEKEKREK